MKKTTLILVSSSLILFSNCGTKTNADTTTSDSTSSIVEPVKTEPDISMSAGQFTNGAIKDQYFADQRLTKRIQLTNVNFGGTEKIGKDEINIWGNDGDIHWTGEFMCCRFIFKVSNPNEQELLQANGKWGTVTGTLVEARENETSPMGRPVKLKEFVFDNVTFTVNPETTQPEQSTVQETTETEVMDSLTVGKIITEKAYFFEEKNPDTRRTDFLPKGTQFYYHTDFKNKNGAFAFVSIMDNQGNTVNQGWILKGDIQDQHKRNITD